MAARIPGSSGAALAAAARRGFISGMDLGFIVAAVVVAVAGVIVLVALPNRAAQADGVHRSADPGSRPEAGLT